MSPHCYPWFARCFGRSNVRHSDQHTLGCPDMGVELARGCVKGVSAWWVGRSRSSNHSAAER
eukprot:2935068-Alexandrium_andersonii.AAC.1